MVREAAPPPSSLTRAIRDASLPLSTDADLDPLLARIGDARLVLLGESTHGTAEFYTWRARITRRLILEKGFSFIAVEGDWPDCYRVNRFVKHYEHAGESAHAVMDDFERWPTWMWANQEVADLAEWLYEHNAPLPPHRRVGFYGLDVYSLFESMDAVIAFLQRADPAAVEPAKAAYSCFEPFGRDEHRYARHVAISPSTCADEAVAVLTDLRRRTPFFPDDAEATFSAEQNAVIAVNAEHYYRAMIRADEESWNIRDEHMADTLDRLLDLHGPAARAVVWAHNTHIGDARATDMAAAGMLNLGQLARERHAPGDTVLIGLSTHHGSVIAGRSWGAPMEVMPVPAPTRGSWDDLIHRADARDTPDAADALLLLDRLADSPDFIDPRPQRAIGVVYTPGADRFGNNVPTILPRRYDALIALDNTHALNPLHLRPAPNELPETYPSGV